MAALACMALLLTACGDDDDPASTVDSSSTTASEGPSTSATEPTGTTEAPSGLVEMTPTSYGQLTLGMSLEDAVALGMTEPFVPGCELAGPDHQAATMVAPYDGAASGDATNGVTAIFVRSHVVTSPGGVKIGDPLATVESAFGDDYVVTVDKEAADTFGSWFVYVAEKDAEDTTVFGLTLDPETGKVTAIGIPHIPTCE